MQDASSSLVHWCLGLVYAEFLRTAIPLASATVRAPIGPDLFPLFRVGLRRGFGFRSGVFCFDSGFRFDFESGLVARFFLSTCLFTPAGRLVGGVFFFRTKRILVP